MMSITYLTILFAHGGHCFGGQPLDITIAWTAPLRAPRAVLVWKLGVAESRIAAGEIAIPDWPSEARLSITPPETNQPVEMTWRYDVYRVSDGLPIEHGTRKLCVYPQDLLTAIANRLASVRLLIVADDEGIRHLFAAAAPRCHTYPTMQSAASALQAGRFDVIVAFDGEVPDLPQTTRVFSTRGESPEPAPANRSLSSWTAQMLENQINTGCRVFVFRWSPCCRAGDTGGTQSESARPQADVWSCADAPLRAPDRRMAISQCDRIGSYTLLCLPTDEFLKDPMAQLRVRDALLGAFLYDERIALRGTASASRHCNAHDSIEAIDSGVQP